MGSLCRGKGLQAAARRSGVGPRQAPGDQCQLDGCQGFHSLAFSEDRTNVPASDPKRNGNTRRGPERIRHIGGAEMSVPGRPTAANATPAPGSKHRLSVLINRTLSGFMTPPAMPPSGWKTAGTIIIAAPLMTARRGPAGQCRLRVFAWRSIRQPSQIRAFHRALPL